MRSGLLQRHRTARRSKSRAWSDACIQHTMCMTWKAAGAPRWRMATADAHSASLMLTRWLLGAGRADQTACAA